MPVENMLGVALREHTAPPSAQIGGAGRRWTHWWRCEERAGHSDVAVSLLVDLGGPREHVLDLGGIATARGPEHLFTLIPALTRTVGGLHFALALVR